MRKLALLLLLAAPAFGQWVPVAGAAGGGDVASVELITTTPVTGAATCTSGACQFTLGLDAAGAYTVASLTDSGLTATRVPFAGVAGLLQDSAALTFSAGTLSATTFAGAFAGSTVTASSLTATRIPFAGTAGLLGDASGFTYVSGAVAVPTSIATTRFLSTGTAPAVANVGADSCGTTAATIAGKDQAHVITVGATSGTECRVTFNVAFANAPVCTVTGQTAPDLHLVTTTTTSTITGTLTAGEKLYEICLGY